MKAVPFFDLDGVLANFVKGALEIHGKELPYKDTRWDFCTPIGFNGPNDPEFWKPMGFEFWRELDPMEDGFKLFGQVERLVGVGNIGILTSPPKTNQAEAIAGKLAWVNRYLPEYVRNVIPTPAKHLIAGPGKILIDDHDGNIEKWEAGGGTGVTFPRPWNKLRGLSDGSLFPYVSWLVENYER